MRDVQILFKNNEQWARSKTLQDPNYFERMAEDQVPLYLWIGCSDSRVPANEVVGLEPGEIFVHRNVANLFPHTDLNSLSVLEFAVDLLKIKHVIVCGHYGCGGVKAAMEDHHLGLVDNWLRNIRDVYARYKEDLEKLNNPIERYDLLVELNAIQQVMNICHTTIVQGAWARNQALSIHAWVYSLKKGRLKDLNFSFSSADQLDDIYKIRLSSN